MALHDLLKKQIRTMLTGFTEVSKGNVYPLIMEEIEKTIILVVLEETKFNYVQAARILGMGRSTLYRKIEALKIDKSSAQENHRS